MKQLFLCERFAVGALIHCRVSLVSTDAYAIQRTIVFCVAMMSALLNSTFDGTVCLIVHTKMPPLKIVEKDEFLFSFSVWTVFVSPIPAF